MFDENESNCLFDENLDDIKGEELIPNSEQYFMLASVETAQGKKETTALLRYSVEIVQGKFKGRRLFGQITYQHESEQTQSIGKREIKELFLASGSTGKADLNQIMDPSRGGRRIFKANVITKKQDGYDDKNEIRKPKRLSDQEIEQVIKLIEQGEVSGEGPASFMARSDTPF